MNLLSFVQEAIAEVVRAEERGSDVSVTTSCLYPTNAFVRVVVRGGQNMFTVSDDGHGFEQIESAGVEHRITDNMVKHLVVEQGLTLRNGVITSPAIERQALPMAIFLVANASKEVADWFYTHLRIKRERNFKQMVRRFLEKEFTQSLRHDEQVVGRSNKSHRFENVIALPNNRKLIVDPVLNDHASISARIVANIDVRQMQYDNVEQRIVYDDDEDWKADDLNLLAMGATVVPFSKAPEVISRIART